MYKPTFLDATLMAIICTIFGTLASFAAYKQGFTYGYSWFVGALTLWTLYWLCMYTLKIGECENV